jgi:hypothetical protein
VAVRANRLRRTEARAIRLELSGRDPFELVAE